MITTTMRAAEENPVDNVERKRLRKSDETQVRFKIKSVLTKMQASQLQDVINATFIAECMYIVNATLIAECMCRSRGEPVSV